MMKLPTILPGIFWALFSSSLFLHGCGGADTTISEDYSAPFNVVVSINNDDAITKSRDITLNLTGSDNVGISACLIAELDTHPAGDDQNWIGLSGQGNLNVQLPYVLSGENDFGQHVKWVYVWLKDAAQNISHMASDDIIYEVLDLTPPINQSVLINNGDTLTNSTDVSLSLAASDNLALTAYFASENSSTPDLLDPEWEAFTPSQDVADIEVSFTLANPGAPGSYNRQVHTWWRDVAGNLSSAANDTIILSLEDYSAPFDVVVAINNDDAITQSLDITLNLTGSDNVGISACLIAELDTPPAGDDQNWIGLSGQGNLDVQLPYVLSGESDFGQHVKWVYVWLKDAAQNISHMASDDIIYEVLDLTPPINQSVLINNGDTLTNSTDVSLSLAASDNLALTAYFASENSSTPDLLDPEWEAFTPSQDVADIEVSFTLANPGAPGSYNRQVHTWWRDVAGNLSSAANDTIILFVADIQAPSDASVLINDGALETDASEVLLTLSASDDVGVTGYFLAEDPTPPPELGNDSWVAVTPTIFLFITDLSFTFGAFSGEKYVHVWFRDAAGNISTRNNDGIFLITQGTPLGRVWQFFGDSETEGRANEVSARSHVLAFTSIWDRTFFDSVSTYSNGVGGRTLPETYISYRGYSQRDQATWVHFQESGYQGSDEDTLEEFLDTFESMVRDISATTPNAVISAETAHSFEAESEPFRDWTQYNSEMKNKISVLASEGITVFLAEVDRNIKELVASKRDELGFDAGQQSVWGDSNNSIGRHYTGLGNVMLALSIYASLGYDIYSLDLSAILEEEVSSADKQLCVEIVNTFQGNP